MQAVIYCRVSTLGQGEDGISLEMQEARARAWCVANGYSVEAVLTETVSGGRMANRPQLQRALQLVCKTRGVLVVFSLSRLSRSLSDTICIAARLERARANLASLTERIDTASAIGNLFFRLIAAMNEFEKDQVGERTRSALAHLRRQGRHISARVPFGYDVAGNMLVANATEQVGLAHIVGWHAEGGSYSGIARRLNESRVRPKYGRSWFASSVRSIILRHKKLHAEEARKDAA